MPILPGDYKGNINNPKQLSKSFLIKTIYIEHYNSLITPWKMYKSEKIFEISVEIKISLYL